MEETTEKQSSPSLKQGPDSTGLSTGAKIGIGIGIIVALTVLALVLTFLIDNPATTETLRDLAIIALALESLVILTLLTVLIYQLIVLINMLRDDVKPMIDSTQETLNTFRGTATFVSERVTKPAIAASSYITGIGRSMSVLFRMRPRRRPTTPTSSSNGGAVPQSTAVEEGD